MSKDREAPRRDFLKRCGKYAACTPPAIVLLLSTTEQKYATAASGASSGGFVSPFESNVRQGINRAPGLNESGPNGH